MLFDFIKDKFHKHHYFGSIICGAVYYVCLMHVTHDKFMIGWTPQLNSWLQWVILKNQNNDDFRLKT